MPSRRRLLCFAACIVTTLFSMRHADAQLVVVTRELVGCSDGLYFAPSSMNAQGALGGKCTNGEGTMHSVGIWRDGAFEPRVSVSTPQRAYGLDINHDGSLLVVVQDPAAQPFLNRGFVYHGDGRRSTIGDLGRNGFLVDLNDDGDVIGHTTDGSGRNSQTFIWRESSGAGSSTPIGPGAAVARNPSGAVLVADHDFVLNKPISVLYANTVLGPWLRSVACEGVRPIAMNAGDWVVGHDMGTSGSHPIWKKCLNGQKVEFGPARDTIGLGTNYSIFDIDEDGNVLAQEGATETKLYDKLAPLAPPLTLDLGEHAEFVSAALSDAHGAGFGVVRFTESRTRARYAGVTFNMVSCLDVDGDGNSDDDGDGLCDSWETTGIDYDRDGDIDLELYDDDRDGMVSDFERPNHEHKDLYVEVDWMEHHAPVPGAIEQVKRAFATASVDNPDGRSGIKLHVLIDERAVEHRDTFSFRKPGAAGTLTFESIKASHFGTVSERARPDASATLAAKRAVFRYAFYGHTLEGIGASGMADLPGADFVVTLGNFSTLDGHKRGNASQQAATFMHELGHALGLKHGGQDDVNCKPNYLSIMSHSRQFDGGPVLGRKLDFAEWALSPLDENSLTEIFGVGGPPAEMTSFVPPRVPLRQVVISADAPVDWNGDGDTDDIRVRADITGPCAPGISVLESFSDWDRLVYDLPRHQGLGEGAPVELDFPAALALSGDTDGDGHRDLEDVCPRVADPAQLDADGDAVGDACDDCPSTFNPSQGGGGSAGCVAECMPDEPCWATPPLPDGGTAGTGGGAGSAGDAGQPDASADGAAGTHAGSGGAAGTSSGSGGSSGSSGSGGNAGPIDGGRDGRAAGGSSSGGAGGSSAGGSSGDDASSGCSAVLRSADAQGTGRWHLVLGALALTALRRRRARRPAGACTEVRLASDSARREAPLAEPRSVRH